MAGSPTCAICHDALGNTERTALECMHAYHAECWNNYCTLLGPRKDLLCPECKHPQPEWLRFPTQRDQSEDEVTLATVSIASATSTPDALAEAAAELGIDLDAVDGMTIDDLEDLLVDGDDEGAAPAENPGSSTDTPKAAMPKPRARARSAPPAAPPAKRPPPARAASAKRGAGAAPRQRAKSKASAAAKNGAVAAHQLAPPPRAVAKNGAVAALQLAPPPPAVAKNGAVAAPELAPPPPAVAKNGADAVPDQRTRESVNKFPFNSAGDVYCSNCAMYTPIVGSRLLAKGTSKWSCKCCLSKTSLMYKHGGKHAKAKFDNIDDIELKRDFMRELQGSGGKDVAAKLDTFLQQYDRSEDTYAEGGEFLPLSVWGNRGFNEHDIATKTLDVDKKQHPVLGDTFRVRIVSKSFVKSKGSVRNENMSSGPVNVKSDSEATATMLQDAISAALSKKRARSSSSSGSSKSGSSDSSSSDSSSKKKKRSKKHKGKKKNSKKNKKSKKKDSKKSKQESAADKKAQELQEKKDAKMAAACVKSATDAAAKISGPKAALDACMGHRLIDQLPSSIKDQAEESASVLQSLEDCAIRVIGSNGADGADQIDMAAVKRAVSTAKAAEAAMQQVFKVLLRG